MNERHEAPIANRVAAERSIDRIGETLRRAFDQAAAEPLPQSFEDLLKQLH